MKNKDMSTSKNGKKKIRIYEGERLEAYKCTAGVWTIGVGITKYLDGTPVRAGDRITAQE